MATLKDIQQAITDTTKYDGADGSPVGKRAVDLAHEILNGVRDKLACGDSDGAVRLFRPDDTTGAAGKLGEHINAYDTKYIFGIRITVGNRHADAMVTLLPSKSQAQPLHQTWGLTIGASRFDLGVNGLDGKVRDDACLHITEAAKVALVEQAKGSLTPRPPRRRLMRNEGGGSRYGDGHGI